MAKKTIEHSPMFEKIKRWYQEGLWNYAQVEMAYKKGVITEDEFDEITKEN